MDTNMSNPQNKTGGQITDEPIMPESVNSQDYSIGDQDDYPNDESETGADTDSSVTEDDTNDGDDDLTKEEEEESANDINANGGYGGESTPPGSNSKA